MINPMEFARHGAVAMIPSKAHRIMSRYRPIAPKPVAYSLNGAMGTEAMTSSSVSADNLACRQTTEISKSKRIRKRRGDSLVSPKSAKKTVLANWLNAPSSMSNSQGGSVLTDKSLHSSGTYGCLRDPGHYSAVGPFCASGGGGVGRCDMSTETFRTSCEKSEVSDCARSGCANSAAVPSPFIGMEGTVNQRSCPRVMGSVEVFQRDAAFMERAAASVPTTALPDKRVCAATTSKSSGFGGAFTEMIRGITGLPTAADVQTLLPPRDVRGSSSTDMLDGVDIYSRGALRAPNSALSLHCTVSDSVPDEEDEARIQLVTLPLLPEAPSRADSPSESSLSTCSSLIEKVDASKRYDGGQVVAETSHPPGLSLAGEDSCASLGSGSCTANNHLKTPLFDRGYIQQVYGSSSDPVLLVGDCQRVLWLNKAYERAAKAASERLAGKTADAGPYIDPLGIPTPLGSFVFRDEVKHRDSMATLWGFLKKFIVQDVDFVKEESDAPSTFPGYCQDWSKHQMESATSHGKTMLRTMVAQIPQQRTSFTTATAGDHREQTKKNGIIIPQAVRLVGSSVSLESVTDVHVDAAPLAGSLDTIKTELEEGTIPAFMTDICKKVRWVNTAYKEMLGQPECPWLLGSTLSKSSSSSHNSKLEGCAAATNNSSSTQLPCPRLAGEVVLACSSELPLSAASFSGRVNIQWTNTGERNSMTVPCDVYRLVRECNNDMWVWKFDISASLRLTCG